MDDRICALDKGRIFESVKYKELMAMTAHLRNRPNAG